jgi:ubiquinone/menaquinone biosynthesis C-methylase UbiE
MKRDLGFAIDHCLARRAQAEKHPERGYKGAEGDIAMATRDTRSRPVLDSAFTGSIPLIYDHCLVPMLFAPWAADLAARIAAFGPRAILETAAGTGVLTELMMRDLPDARIVATDLNPAMLDLARHRLPGVHLEPADAQSLRFADESFDVVACQFGVMFYTDRPAAQREARRVLRDGGHYVFTVWDQIVRNPAARAVADAVAALFPYDPPHFLERTPFGHYDTAALADELRTAGFSKVEVTSRSMPHGRVTAHEAAEGLCRGTPLSVEINAHGNDAMERAIAAAEHSLARFIAPDGRLDAPMAAHVIIATA